MGLTMLKSLPSKTAKVTKMIFDMEEKLIKGYNHLLTFEAKSGGYEWFGESPGHEALSAYGLMQFFEMSEVLSKVIS